MGNSIIRDFPFNYSIMVSLLYRHLLWSKTPITPNSKPVLNPHDYHNVQSPERCGRWALCNALRNVTRIRVQLPGSVSGSLLNLTWSGLSVQLILLGRIGLARLGLSRPTPQLRFLRTQFLCRIEPCLLLLSVFYLPHGQ